MWGASEEPPGTMEGGPPEPIVNAKETCEQNKNQLESLKEIMMRNKQSLKKKEEEVQEYVRRLSKIKSRTKLSRRSKEASTSKDTTAAPAIQESIADAAEDVVDDISQAKTPKAKSSLLQRKLAENRKVFEQRNKEMTETKRAVEEKVEAIRQQLDEKPLAMELQRDPSSITPVRPIMVMSEVMTPMMQLASFEEKDIKIEELSKRIMELEATVMDLRENLKEKDSVIESKTQAVTLMSMDLSRKGKTTLDTLEDTKDEMRTMQEHFVLLETSLRNKNENLLEQLHERDNRILEMDTSIKRLEEQIKKQQLAESTSADLTRSTMDTLADTKDAMKSMQENFVFIESSLKMKNDNLFQQLQDYEVKLAEANERIFQLESGAGIVKDPGIEDLQIKLEKMERNNRQLQDEKYELQKSIAEMQDKIITSKSVHGNGALMEKDNRIAELENLIEELKQSNKLLEEESNAELQKQLAELTIKNEEYCSKINDLEKTIHDLEIEKNNIAERLPDETTADEKVLKLTKELDELNKSMIKVKAQHRSKIKNLQKQIESFKMVSDVNAELVKLGNQVTLLEEEKGNLQLSLVDFDELKAAVGDWQERIADLESKVSAQTKEIQMHVDAIATLENQKLDLMQELHSVKQEVSALEAENAESENLRVTAEMKVVDLEEQLESMHKSQSENKTDSANYEELVKKVESLTQENNELYRKLSKLEEKGTSDSGSTESFETFQETDKNELLKKIEKLTQKNNELILKLNKLEEKEDSHAGSTESFEAINDTDKNELLKKIDQLTQENNDLMMKLHRNDEKGSSDTGSTESFERIPEQNETLSKIELLTQENNELVIKVTKLEEKILNSMKTSLPEGSDMETMIRDYHNMEMEVEKLKTQISELLEENTNLQKRIEAEASHEDEIKSKMETLSEENTEVIIKLTKLEEQNQDLKNELFKLSQERDELLSKIRETVIDDFSQERKELIDKLEKLNLEKENVVQERQKLHEQINSLLQKPKDESQELEKESSQQMELDIVATLEREIHECKQLIAEQTGLVEEMKIKLASKEEELEEKRKQIMHYEASEIKNEVLEREMKEMLSTIEEWKFKCNEIQEKMELLEAGKASIEEGFRKLQEENKNLIMESEQKDAATNAMKEQLEEKIKSLEAKLQQEISITTEKEEIIISLKEEIAKKDQELHAKYMQLQNEMIVIDGLQDELNNCKMELQDKNATIASLSAELERMKEIMTSTTEEMESSRKEIAFLSEQLVNSKSLQEYNDVLKKVKETQMSVEEMDKEIAELEKKNEDLSAQIGSTTQNNVQMQNQLTDKQDEIVELLALREQLESQVVENANAKNELERRAFELQGMLDNNVKFIDELQSELNNSYKTLEQVKLKHVEDMNMQNRRLEDMIDDLEAKTQENEALKTELQNKLAGQNVTEETKHALEAQIIDLQQKLTDSEKKTQAQLEKMKKIAATLQKKKTVCQELEARVAELEEKWTTEKDEKEAKNKQIQEVESCLREKDNKIADLEEKLQSAKNETVEALSKVDAYEIDLSNTKEKMTVLMGQITEMGEEIERLRRDADQLLADLSAEKSAKEMIVAEYESYKEQTSKDKEQQQTVLDEVKENARELNVRMQVMEAEYMDQLALITNLKTENGMLSSKQMQISEKLENVEKESEERRLLIEELQKEIGKTVTATTQTSTSDAEETRLSNVQCERCDQCQTVVQALEAKLQEREAEIENLDNELANSIVNFVQMGESMRFNDMMNRSRSRDLEDPYNDLLRQYNTLTASHEEIKAKLNETVKENRKLLEKVESVQSLNSTLEEKVASMEQELSQSKEAAEKLQNIEVSSIAHSATQEDHNRELRSMQQELQTAQEHANQYKEQLNSYIKQSDLDKQELTKKYEDLVDLKQSLMTEIEHLNKEKDRIQSRLQNLEDEVEMYKRKTEETFETPAVIPEPQKHSDEPQLFDAFKVFGVPSVSDSDNRKEIEDLQSIINEKESHCNALSNEINQLQKQIAEERLQMSQEYDQCVKDLKLSQENCEGLQTEIARLDQVLVEKNREIDTLNIELNNVGLQLKAQFQQDDSDENIQLIRMKDREIEDLRLELNSTRDSLETLVTERSQQNQILESYENQIIDMEKALQSSTNGDTLKDLEDLLSTTLKEKDLLQIQITDLTRELADSKDLIKDHRNLQVQIENITRERDEAKEQIINLAQKIKEKSNDQSEDRVETQPAVEKVTAKNMSLESMPMHGKMEQIPQLAEEEEVPKSSHWEEDEETWGWNPEDAQLAGEQHLDAAAIVPSAEVQLRAKIDEQQDRIKDLEAENLKIIEESKVAQVRSGKLVKKLKEYKVQIDSLQQQLKLQKSGGFCELDSAIEEELKSQITGLEKSLKDVKEELKNVIAEKEGLLKRLDVVTAANERYMEMKERQDMDVEVLKLQNKELTSKLQNLEWKFQEQSSGLGDDTSAQIGEQTESVASLEPTKQLHKRETSQEDTEALCKQYKNELDQLKEDMEALATENEQLQQFLEGQKNKILNLETQLIASAENSSQNVEEIMQKNAELQAKLDKSKEDYDILRRQYEQSLMDANDQVTITRQNSELLKIEFSERNSKLEAEVADLQKKIEMSKLTADQLEKDLQTALDEKATLQQRNERLVIIEEELANVTSSLAEVTDLLNVRVQEVADLKQELQKQYIERQESEAKLHDTINMLGAELSDKRIELENLKKALVDKENELIQQKSVQTVNAVVSEATQELAQMHAIELEEKDKALRNLTERLVNLQSTLDNYASELQDNAAKVDMQQQEITGLTQKLMDKDMNLESVKMQLTATQEELDSRLTALQEEARTKESEIIRRNDIIEVYKSEQQMYLSKVAELENLLNKTDADLINLQTQTSRVHELEQEIEGLRASWSEKEIIMQRLEQESKHYQAELQRSNEEIDKLRDELRQIPETKERIESVNCLVAEVEELQRLLENRESLIDTLNQKLSAKELESDKAHSNNDRQTIVDGLPLFRMGGNDSGNDDMNLQSTIDELKAAIETKQQEIDHLKYVLSENTYPRIIQEMQDRINCLYDEKTYVESSLQTVTQDLAEKEKQIESMKQLVDAQRQELIAKEESSFMSKERKLDQEKIISLQNELHAKEQEMNELKYVIAEKDSQLSLQASMEPQSDDFELRETVQRLTEELYAKEQEVQHLKSTIGELQSKLIHLEELEKLSEENKNAIQRLLSEKEQIRIEAEEFLQRRLAEKEAEINEIKQQLFAENRKLLEEFQLKDKDIENLKKQLEESSIVWSQRFHHKEEELLHASADLAEKERRLAELSITKDAELHNLKVQIHDRDVRIEELLVLSEEEEKQLNELRKSLDARETELNFLKEQLEEKTREYELIQRALKKDVPVVEAGQSDPESESKPAISNELDLALYMLHQRDVRCEELTHELMQLLEERDTLQLRLSNAIRVNEELRRSASSDFSPKMEVASSSSGIQEPIVEQPSPSKSQGPVEIAKEAINDPIGEDKEALALNERRSEPVERPAELAVGQKHAESGAYVMNEM